MANDVGREPVALVCIHLWIVGDEQFICQYLNIGYKSTNTLSGVNLSAPRNGRSIREMTRRTGLSRNTVRKYQPSGDSQ